MRITVTTASQTLRELLTVSQYNDIQRTKEGVSISYAFLVISGSVFMETNGIPATVANGYPITEIVVDETTIKHVSLISSLGSADVRLIAF